MLRRLRASGNRSLLLDLGSNLGMYTTAAAANGYSVLAFEPVPSNAARLLATTRRNAHMAMRVRLATMCVSEDQTVCQIGTSLTNQGGTRHIASDSLGVAPWPGAWAVARGRGRRPCAAAAPAASARTLGRGRGPWP